jgi:hypothetical protein
MKTSLVLLYLVTGLMYGFLLLGAWAGAHMVQGGAHVPVIFWIGVAGILGLLIAIIATVLRARIGALVGLICCALLWCSWGPELVFVLTAAAGTGVVPWEHVFYSLPLLAASALSCFVLARSLRKVDVSETQ